MKLKYEVSEYNLHKSQFQLFPTGYPAGKTASQEGRSAWAAFWVILVGLVVAAAGAYLVYKYRIRVSFVTFSVW